MIEYLKSADKMTLKELFVKQLRVTFGVNQCWGTRNKRLAHLLIGAEDMDHSVVKALQKPSGQEYYTVATKSAFVRLDSHNRLFSE